MGEGDDLSTFEENLAIGSMALIIWTNWGHFCHVVQDQGGMNCDLRRRQFLCGRGDAPMSLDQLGPELLKQHN